VTKLDVHTAHQIPYDGPCVAHAQCIIDGKWLVGPSFIHIYIYISDPYLISYLGQVVKTRHGIITIQVRISNTNAPYARHVEIKFLKKTKKC
jgi:hypothetical protein